MFSPYWKQLDNPTLSWVKNFSRIVSKTQLPLMNGSTLLITTDYGGSQSKSRYYTIAILMVDQDNSRAWEGARRRVREEFLSDGRRMSFKALNDTQRQSALIPFLRASDLINGICICIAIRKDISNLVADKQILDMFNESKRLRAKWKAKTFDQMMTIAHFVSVLIAGFSKPHQNVYWISDEDSIFANRAFADDVCSIVAACTAFYAEHELGETGVGTTNLDEGDRWVEDLTAIPDMVAGVVAELLTALHMMAPTISEHLVYPVPRLSGKVKTLTEWLADDTQRLRRLIIVLDKVKGDQVRSTRLNIKEVARSPILISRREPRIRP